MQWTFIYALTDPRDGRVRYVGKSDDPKRRRKHHVLYSKDKTAKSRWVREVLSAGYEPGMKILERCLVERWQERERFWIGEFDDLTNGTSGGDGVDAPRTEEWRRKMSESLKGRIITESMKAALHAHNKAKHDDGCKYGHPWTPENTCMVQASKGNPYRVCRQCSRERREKERREQGILPREEWVPPTNEFCHLGHPMSGDNLRICVRSRGRVERICRECVRIRNRECKARKRQKMTTQGDST